MMGDGIELRRQHRGQGAGDGEYGESGPSRRDVLARSVTFNSIREQRAERRQG